MKTIQTQMALEGNHTERMRTYTKSPHHGAVKMAQERKRSRCQKAARDSEQKHRARRDDTAQLEGIGYSCWCWVRVRVSECQSSGVKKTALTVCDGSSIDRRCSCPP
ncbi:MAG: uncharacterized protein A8A55_0438 [Amphiamblys sp. WSBS2006]|nr:MAG: uncharacterized protein A8A55_0438 [Amphiamblys sp. WSBS2006]